MRKSVVLLGLVLSSWLTASPVLSNDGLNKSGEDLPVNIQHTTVKTDMLKAKWVKIQLKNNKSTDLEKGIRLLKELKPIISKLEKEKRYKEVLK